MKITPSMTMVCIGTMVVSTVLFLASFYWLRELSIIPLAWLTSTGLCTLLYLVDRYGFAQIDTIAKLQDADSEWMYFAWLMAYSAMLVFGHLLAYYIIGV